MTDIDIRLSALNIYPVKSMRGIALPAAELDALGLRHDRRWMVVDEQGQFLTGRQLPRLLLIQPALSPAGALTLVFPDGTRLAVPPAAPDAPRLPVQVWRDTVEALAVDADVDAALSEFLGRPCRLVSFAEDVVRPVDPDYARPGDRTGFADGFPLLLISEASLADLNTRLLVPLPMARFRPNLVVSGCAPYAEDDWREIRIGDIPFELVKPCSRCVMTTTNPDTGAREGQEPLRTLATYRRCGNKVYFGQNVVHRGRGLLRVGDAVTVRARA